MASQTYVDQDPEEQPLGELFSDLTSNLQLLLRKEVELAKVEATEQAKRAGKAGAMFGASAALAFVGLLLLAFAAAWGLAEVIPTGLAFLAVAIVVLAVAGLCVMQGKKNVAEIRPPQQTVDTLKQDVQVAQTSLKRGMKSDTTPGSKGR